MLSQELTPCHRRAEIDQTAFGLWCWCPGLHSRRCQAIERHQRWTVLKRNLKIRFYGSVYSCLHQGASQNQLLSGYGFVVVARSYNYTKEKEKKTRNEKSCVEVCRACTAALDCAFEKGAGG
jgi:hypothetical protein